MAEPGNLKTNAVAAFLLKSLKTRIRINWSHSIVLNRQNQFDYGTSLDTRVQSFEDYDWEQDRMIRYRPNDKGGIEPNGYES